MLFVKYGYFFGSNHYYVYNFSDINEIPWTYLTYADIGPEVKVYDDTGSLVETFTTTGNPGDRYWKVFTLDGDTGDINPVNEFTNSDPYAIPW